ncbi:MAG: diguanylate cyclase [Gammaproteobacteria bacterium]|nr:diguanylate cyclase [Gammaproteobacteria bacterium]
MDNNNRSQYRIHEQSIVVLLLFLILAVSNISHAEPRELSGTWLQAPTSGWSYQSLDSLGDEALHPEKAVSLTGGKFVYHTEFDLAESGSYVIDFKNTSIIGQFRHYLYDSQQQLLVTLEGGIENPTANPFFLRHGREVDLAAGRYHLVTLLDSDYYLAQPEPYIDTLNDYRNSIRSGNVVVLVGLGIFLGLGIYYAALGLVRLRMAEGMYALFILGNLLFNAGGHLLASQLFGFHSIYLASVPILFSNLAYIAFVRALLCIEHDNHPYLHRIGSVLMLLMAAMLVAAMFLPNWSLEFARYGVGLFLVYGLAAGLIRARQGDVTARFYLVAIGLFFVFGGIAISQTQLVGVYTLHIEHVGLFSVAVEVVLLALVLAYQFGQLHREKEHILKSLKHSRRLAHTDALTGMPNRYALDKELETLPQEASLTFIDLDRLKYYNDLYGHAKGDELLIRFSNEMAKLLDKNATIYRVGGDEFAVTCQQGNLDMIESVLAKVIQRMHKAGFEMAGASAGSAYVRESHDKSELKHLADLRMYESKNRYKKELE